MVQTPEITVPSVIDDLLRTPERYSFIQAVRLLYIWSNTNNSQEFEAFLRTTLRFRPNLHLGFAATDITDLAVHTEEHENILNKAQVTATFLGLYGSSSPLPRFYTERLLEEQANDTAATRDFLDILNNQFFLLHALLTSYEDPTRKYIAEAHPKAEHMLMSLASFGHESFTSLLPNARIFLRYAAFFFQRTRTASGLRAIIADAAQCPNTHITSNIFRLATIPKEQRFCLGVQAHALGEEATLGDAVPSYEGKIAISLSGLYAQGFRNLLPGTKLAIILRELIRNYCRQPIIYTLSFELLTNQARAVTLSGYSQGHFATLGHDTWLGFGGTTPHAPLPAVTAFFPNGYL